MLNKDAKTGYPINELIKKRWSPRAFSSRVPQKEMLLSLFEAARWAASSMNEQPWRFIYATKNEPENFERLLSSVNEFNAVWVKDTPVLIVTAVSKNFDRNGNPNVHAWHDLGLAVGNLVVQATELDLYLHQMAGIDRDKATEVCKLPEGYEAVTALAMGYLGEAEQLSDKLINIITRKKRYNNKIKSIFVTYVNN